MRDTAHGLKFVGQGVNPNGRVLERDGKPVAIRVDRRGQNAQDKVSGPLQAGADLFGGLADAMVADHAEERDHRLAAR
jgi:hypothetical protein